MRGPSVRKLMSNGKKIHTVYPKDEHIALLRNSKMESLLDTVVYFCDRKGLYVCKYFGTYFQRNLSKHL
jgi:hypothetical protein